MARFDLSDCEWRVIPPLLPNNPPSVPQVDDLQVLNGIFWRLRDELLNETLFRSLPHSRITRISVHDFLPTKTTSPSESAVRKRTSGEQSAAPTSRTLNPAPLIRVAMSRP